MEEVEWTGEVHRSDEVKGEEEVKWCGSGVKLTKEVKWMDEVI